jgi:hypothetical protein
VGECKRRDGYRPGITGPVVESKYYRKDEGVRLIGTLPRLTCYPDSASFSDVARKIFIPFHLVRGILYNFDNMFYTLFTTYSQLKI